MSEFLAEARVLVRPDTTAFRAQLLAEITAATAGVTASVPITVASTGAAAAATRAVTEATREVAAAQQVAGAATTKASVASRELARAHTASEVAIRRLGIAQASVLNATTSLASAQITATRSAAALSAAESAVGRAVLAQNPELVAATRNTLALAEAQALEANSALQAARAQSIHSTQLSTAGRGAGATALSLLGVRGATLAANASFLAGAAAIAVFAKSVSLAANLERELDVFQETAGATADEMGRVAEEARRLGADISLPGVAAGDAAVAMTELAKAGLDVQDSISGARGVLLLATAAEIDNAAATEIVANALNAFGLAGTEAVRVADLLAAASIEAQGSIADMGGALTQAASVSRQVGISLEDTVALLTLLAKNGIQGAAAGTVLRVALLRLVNPTGQVNELLQDLGVNIRNAQGQVRPEIFAELASATDRLTKAQQDQALAQIFGVRGLRAQAILGREGIAALDSTRVATQDLGAAQDLAAARTKGFLGDVDALKSSLETLGVSIGNVTIPVLSQYVGAMTDAVGVTNVATEAIRDFGDTTIPVLGRVGDRFGEVTQIIGPTGFLGPFGQFKVAGALIGAFGDDTDEAAEQTINFASALHQAAVDAATLTTALTSTGKAGGLSIPQITGQIAGLEEQLVGAQITEDRGAQTDILRQQEERLREQLSREGISNEFRRETQRQLLQVITERRSIERGIQSEREQAEQDRKTEAERHAREVQRLRDEADRAFLASIDVQEQRLQNRLLRAANTESLKDDIQRNLELRNFYRQSLADVRSTVKDAETRAKEIANLTRDLIDVNQEIEQARQELAEQRQRERQEARERQQESLALDVSIAEATGNRGAEIRAREAEIQFIERQIRATRKGSLQRKRLILELREAQKELAELKDEQAGTAGAFRELTFEFLQAQQGFASNLLGNLIPEGAAGGLVGNVAAAVSPAAGLGQAAGKADGKERGGFSAGQGNTTNEILRRILRSVDALNGREAAPEARTQRVMSSGSGDYQVM